MKAILLCSLVTCNLLLACSKGESSPAKVVEKSVYQNGLISTGTVSSSGVSAPTGTSWSEAQSSSGSSTANTSGGYACYYNNFRSYRTADDFKVPEGDLWTISKISVYAFDGTTANPPFDGLHLRIWDKDPSEAGANVIYGDLTTNVLSETTDSLIYSIQNSSTPAPGIPVNTNNKIWKLSAKIDKTLPAGTYWLEWQVHSISGNESFTPTIKIKGSRGLPHWNALVYNSLNVWQWAVDLGNPGVFPALRQDLPFEIDYSH